MKGPIRAALALAATAALQGPAPAFAQAATDTAGTPPVDPVAIQALKGMASYLASLKTFEIHTRAEVETSLADTDLTVDLGVEGTYKVSRPDAFYVQLKSDRQVREYYFDGKAGTFTVNVPRQDFFATVSAPSTINAVVDDIYDRYDITLPLADLFYWAREDAPTDGITTAVRVGYAKVGKADADQFLYRGEDLEWQIWIARGAKPLPLKIAIKTLNDPDRPSYTATLDWNTAASFAPATFAFKPGPKATPIRLAAADEAEN
jgi:hypothetical protein